MAAVSCNDKAVIDEFIGTYVCGSEGLFECASVGFTYQQLKSLGSEEIRRLVTPKLSKAMSTIRSEYGATKNATRFSDYLVGLYVNAFLGAKTVVASVNVTTSDYNPTIKRYECRATIKFDADSLNGFVLLAVTLASIGNPRDQVFLDGALKSNDEALMDIFKGATKNQATSGMSKIGNTVSFAVQPLNPNAWFNSDFVVIFNSQTAVAR